MQTFFRNFLFFTLLFSLSCKPSAPKSDVGTTVPKATLTAYAKFTASVRKDKNLKEWLATVNKTEPVEIIDVIEVPDKKNSEKKIAVAQVKLADGSQGYIKRSWLGGTPFVVLEKIRCFAQPDYASKVRATLEVGTILFQEEADIETVEPSNWIKVWAGKIDGVWLTSLWVENNDKISNNSKVVIDARDYQDALDLIEKNKNDVAIKKLKSLSEFSDSTFAQMALEQLEMLEAVQVEDIQETPQEDQSATKEDASTETVAPSNE